MTSERPLTPCHPEPDEVLNTHTLNELDDNDIMDLDLNPELDSSGFLMDNNDSKRTYDLDDVNRFDDVDDFKPIINVGSPYSSNMNLNALNNSNSIKPLSTTQQSKFIVYCDSKLLAIQRKYVQSRGLNINNGYTSLIPLFDDLKALIDFIWYSIDPNLSTEKLISIKDSNVDYSQYAIPTTYFGQGSYLLRIADDFIEYLEKFEIKQLPPDEQSNCLSKLFKLIFILDTIFARLLRGAIPGRVKLSGTESVRLNGIAERTRVKLPSYLEAQNIHGYHYEVSKIYQQSLELIGM